MHRVFLWIIGLLIVLPFVLYRSHTHLGVSPAETDRIGSMETLAATARGFDLSNTITLLGRTPATPDALLRDLPDAWTRRNEDGETWTAYDVIGHLIHCEKTDGMPRAKIILQFGQARTFDPFDRFAQQRDRQGKSLVQLLDEFAALRAVNLADLRAMHLTTDDLKRRGLGSGVCPHCWRRALHPALGVVTLSELLATWAAHDLTHLHHHGTPIPEGRGPVGALTLACCNAASTVPDGSGLAMSGQTL